MGTIYFIFNKDVVVRVTGHLGQFVQVVVNALLHLCYVLDIEYFVPSLLGPDFVTVELRKLHMSIVFISFYYSYLPFFKFSVGRFRISAVIPIREGALRRR